MASEAAALRAGRRHAAVLRPVSAVRLVTLLGAGALTFNILQEQCFAAFPHGPTRMPQRVSRITLQAEAFDPFGWKGQLKNTAEGLMDALQGTDEEPTREEEQMVNEIFGKYDLDKDGVLNLEEFNTLQVTTEGQDATYDKEQLKQLLVAVNPDIQNPYGGMPFSDYRRLYLKGSLRRAYNTDVNKDYKKIFGRSEVEGNPADFASFYARSATGEEAGLGYGVKVTIEGLNGAKELNGQTAEIVAPLENEQELVGEGRVVVKLSDGERVALKPANVKRQVSSS
eukprot:TRINITY_DN107266_c0_g1_i1.p1 TRINITY_DN107266_c0_g1~~TRINITY_DN107266_c0_g1_i1.p1  ORF type:complete len:301 (+),score=73.41 TRINITY_DN107266_c0_g1_i1:56-904(+)